MRDILLLGADRVSQVLTSMLCTGLIGRTVGVTEFGHWQLALTLFFLLTAFANVATPDFALPKMVEGAEAPRRMLSLVWSVRAKMAVTTGCIFGFLAAFFAGDHPAAWLLLLLIPSLIREPALAVMMWQIARRDVLPYIAVSLFTMALRIALTYALFFQEAKISLFSVPILIENILFFALLTRRYRSIVDDKCGVQPNWRKALNVKALFWAWLALLLTLLSVRIDRLILAWLTDETSYGLYTAAGQISDNWYFVGMILSGTVGAGYIYNASTTLRAIRNTFSATVLVLALVLLGAVIVTLLAPLVIFVIFGDHFFGAASILGYSIFSLALLPVNMVVSLPLVRAERMDLIALKGLIASVSVASLLPVFYAIWGIEVAVVAVAIGQAISIAFSCFVLWRWRNEA